MMTFAIEICTMQLIDSKALYLTLKIVDYNVHLLQNSGGKLAEGLGGRKREDRYWINMPHRKVDEGEWRKRVGGSKETLPHILIAKKRLQYAFMKIHQDKPLQSVSVLLCCKWFVHLYNL